VKCSEHTVQTYDGLPIHHKRGLNEIQGVYFDDKFELE